MSKDFALGPLGRGSASLVTIGRGSAMVGWIASTMSQQVIGSSGVLHCQTLSGLVQLPAVFGKVGSPFRSIIGATNYDGLKGCLFESSSHIG
jgi:hypothetical protein